MRQIILTKGYKALVSDEDYQRIKERKWFVNLSGKPRACRSSLRKVIYMHHEVLGVTGPSLKVQGLVVDHIDGNPLNNTRENLRITDFAGNARNTARHKERVGYCFNRRANLFSCYIDEPGEKRRYIGYAKTEVEAKAKVEAARANY